MSNFVFVIDTNLQPLNAVHPGQARRLLKQGQAAVYRSYPFAIILKHTVSHHNKLKMTWKPVVLSVVTVAVEKLVTVNQGSFTALAWWGGYHLASSPELKTQ